MAKYSFSQLEGLWINAGGSKALAPLMAAIALAESSGDSQATNPTDNNGTQTSWGLWQISNGTHDMPVANILDPQVNARAAVAKYKAQGLSAWGTYTSGIYKKYLPSGYVAPDAQLTSATTAAGGPLLGPLDPFHLIDQAFKDIAGMLTGGASVAGGIGAIAETFAALGKSLNTIFTDLLWLFKPSHWVRIFAFMFGIGALLPGVWMLSKAGKGEGDISLALGILLVMAGGMLLFIAFHNLPDDVSSLQTLLGHISGEIRKSSPATTG